MQYSPPPPSGLCSFPPSLLLGGAWSAPSLGGAAFLLLLRVPPLLLKFGWCCLFPSPFGWCCVLLSPCEVVLLPPSLLLLGGTLWPVSSVFPCSFGWFTFLSFCGQYCFLFLLLVCGAAFLRLLGVVLPFPFEMLGGAAVSHSHLWNSCLFFSLFLCRHNLNHNNNYNHQP